MHEMHEHLISSQSAQIQASKMIFGKIRGLFLVILVYRTAVIFVSDCAFLLSSTFQALQMQIW